MTESLEAGRTLAGRYRLVARLGRGGFGEVWRAEDSTLGRDVAVKVLTVGGSEATEVERFTREAHALAQFAHPNVVTVYDSGTDDGTAFVVMQLLSGPSLAALIAEEAPLPVERAIDLARQAAAGLAAAHAAGIVHRDVTPANLILDGGTVQLVDFGTARLAASSALTATGTVFATPGYVSPEQAEGRTADARSDIYSLGCVLYALLAGEPPFTAEHPIGVVQQHLTQEAAPIGTRRGDIPPQLDALLASMLAKDPNARPASAAEVERALAYIGESFEPAADMAPTRLLPVQPTPLARRSRVGPIAALVALLLLALGGALAAFLIAGGSAAAPPDRSTKSTTHTRPTTHATTATAPPPRVRTPQQAIAAARTAILRAENTGQLDAHAGDDLNHHLDDIAKSLETNPQDAAHKVADLRKHLSDLEKGGQLTNAGFARIDRPLARLAALLPAVPR